MARAAVSIFRLLRKTSRSWWVVMGPSVSEAHRTIEHSVSDRSVTDRTLVHLYARTGQVVKRFFALLGLQVFAGLNGFDHVTPIRAEEWRVVRGVEHAGSIGNVRPERRGDPFLPV